MSENQPPPSGAEGQQPGGEYPPSAPQPYGSPVSGGYQQPGAYQGGSYQPPPPGYPGAGYQYGQPARMPETCQNAVVAFVLAIVSWVVCPIVCAIVALVMASNARKEIESSNGWKTGAGFVTAARWIAWINIIFMGILLIVYILFVIFVIVLGATSTTYQ